MVDEAVVWQLRPRPDLLAPHEGLLRSIDRHRRRVRLVRQQLSAEGATVRLADPARASPPDRARHFHLQQ